MSGPGENQPKPVSLLLPEGTVIRPMTPADVEEVAALEKVCFPTAWTKESYLRELANPHGCYLVARKAGPGRLLGYAGLRVVGPEAHVSTLCVAPECRRQGLAKALLGQALTLARERGASRALLEVREGNLAARQLYEGFGFCVIALHRGYYGDSGENALVMWKELQPSETCCDTPAPG